MAVTLPAPGETFEDAGESRRQRPLPSLTLGGYGLTGVDPAVQGRRVVTLPASILLHTAAALSLVVVPLLTSDAIPERTYVVEIFRVRGEDLIGRSPDELRGLMEVRGLGLLSIEQLFGAVSVRDSKPIDLVIRLVPGSTLHLERLGLAESTEEFLGVSRPCLSVPVAPGRSLALLVECAARKYLLSQRGVPDLAKEFLIRHDRQLERP